MVYVSDRVDVEPCVCVKFFFHRECLHCFVRSMQIVFLFILVYVWTSLRPVDGHNAWNWYKFQRMRNGDKFIIYSLFIVGCMPAALNHSRFTACKCLPKLMCKWCITCTLYMHTRYIMAVLWMAYGKSYIICV